MSALNRGLFSTRLCAQPGVCQPGRGGETDNQSAYSGEREHLSYPRGTRTLRRQIRKELHSDTVFSIILPVGKADKILGRMRSNPRDWRIESLEMIASRYAIVVRKSRGSHVVFSHPCTPIAVTVPARKPIKPPYIRQFLALIDDIEV